MHDSWEPVENVHAPDLVKEFYEREPLAIRMIRMDIDSPVSPHPAIKLPLCQSKRSPSSTIEPPLVPPTTPIDLPYVHPCQYFVMLPLRLNKPRAFGDKRGDSPEYQVRTPTPELMLPPVSPLPVPHGKAGWPQAKFLRPRPENCSISDDTMESASPLLSPPPEPHREAMTPPSVTAGLSDPMTELGIEAHETPATHPGPPWFRWAEAPVGESFVVKILDRDVFLPYLCYRQIGAKTYQYGTEGNDRRVYSREVHLQPHAALMGVVCDINDVEYFLRDLHFNVPLSQALDLLDDPGLVAEVARYQGLHLEMGVLAQMSKGLNVFVVGFFKFFTDHQAATGCLINEIEACKTRLKDGHAREHIHQAVLQLTNSNAVGGRFYWQGLPGLNEHPNRLVFPPYRHEQDLACEADSAINHDAAIRRVAQEALLRTRKRETLCRWCGLTGHFFKDCPAPHTKCRGKCYVCNDHAYFKPQYCRLERAVQSRGRPPKRPEPSTMRLDKGKGVAMETDD